MKMYYFYPESYGNEYFVMSDSLETAKEKVREKLIEISKEFKWYKEEKHIEDVLSRVRIIDENVVIETEIS